MQALLEHTSDEDSLLNGPAVEYVAGAWAEAIARDERLQRDVAIKVLPRVLMAAGPITLRTSTVFRANG